MSKNDKKKMGEMDKLEKRFKALVAAELPTVEKEQLYRVLQHLMDMDLIPPKRVRQYYIVRQYPIECQQNKTKSEVIAALGNVTGLGDTQVRSAISNSSRMFEHKKRGPKPS